ncbi:NAD(P)/FAD-dependent oxidoreductase [Spongiimicrobium salis]|uniref:NAD(P)/FAD-dependent oxidoreductase n=1 Tax=Spongiimicrobium salis TaxID=1667022 RepID=UPI00374D09E8
MNKEIVIIGGGIMGLCTAYYALKEGHKVTIVDQSNMDQGASYVNAGYLSPSHIIPLSAPGVMKQGIRWMFNKSSPLYIKPRLNVDFIRWTLAFNRSCNAKHVERSAPIIRDIAVWSQRLYEDIRKTEGFSFHYEKKGLFMLCQTEKMLEKEAKVIALANDLGLEASLLDKKGIEKLEPNIGIEALGAAYFKCDHHTTPGEFMAELKTYLEQNGVTFLRHEKVVDLSMEQKRITALATSKRQLKADNFVLAAGSWSNFLSKKIGLTLLLQAGKGYRINTKNPTGIRIPAILAEAKCAVTPMNGFTRFAGTMEIAGIQSKINPIRVEAIAQSVQRYYPELEITAQEKKAAACGLRPVSPDGLPYIGVSSKCSNLVVATGHAMMGWSMGAATGKLVSEIISEKKPSLDLSPYHPDRKF